MGGEELQQLKNLKKKFIEKVIIDFGDSYMPIKKNDFESINLSALVNAILKKNKEKIPEHKLKEYLVSEQTLRRIFEEREKETTFQQTTRNFLSLYLNYQNYQDFLTNADFNQTPTHNSLPWKNVGISILALVIILVVAFVWKNKVMAKPITGKLSKVFFESNKAPITVKFDYRFSHTDFGHAYLDYSLWYQKKDTLTLDKSKQSASVCFIHPTVRTVKLVADGNVVDSTKVIIPSDGWVAGYEGIFYLADTQWKKNGVAHIAKEGLPDEIKEKPTYYSFIKKVGNFPKVVCDDMIFETRLKNPVDEGGIMCNDVSVVFTGGENKALFNLTQKGCSHYAYVRLPDKSFEGKNYNLSKLGVNLDEFVRLKIVFRNKMLHVYINDQLAFSTKSAKNLGKLDAVYMGFKGLGSVDYIKISNNTQLLEEENF